jgi:hypothetical protein
MGGGGTIWLVGQSTYCGNVAITIIILSVVTSLLPNWPVVAYPSQLSFVLIRSRRVCSHPLSPSSTLALIHSYALVSKPSLLSSDLQPLVLADLALFELVPTCPC